MTLIEYRSSSGERHRCDARCYNATGGVCTCICGGRNHGVGLSRAVFNTEAIAEEWTGTLHPGADGLRERIARVRRAVHQAKFAVERARGGWRQTTLWPRRGPASERR